MIAAQEMVYLYPLVGIIVIMGFVILLMFGVVGRYYRKISSFRKDIELIKGQLEDTELIVQRYETAVRHVIERYFADLYERFQYETRGGQCGIGVLYTAHMLIDRSELDYLYGLYLNSIGKTSSVLYAGNFKLPLHSFLQVFEYILKGETVIDAMVHVLPEADIGFTIETETDWLNEPEEVVLEHVKG
jgi:hypothetical protein